MINPFRKFFQAPPDPEELMISESHEILAWCEMPYTAKFRSWIDHEIDRPLPLGAKLEEAVIRQNTFKEIRSRIKLLETRSHARVQEERSDGE